MAFSEKVAEVAEVAEKLFFHFSHLCLQIFAQK
jgi:hypothetical protein